MKTLVLLSMLVCCSMAVPQIPTTFQTKVTMQIWDGSKLTFQSTQGYLAQDYDRNTSIFCANYTNDQSYQLQTQCQLSLMRSSQLFYINYIMSPNGTVTECEVDDTEDTDFYGFFDWVSNTWPVGRFSDTCFQELEKWQYDIDNTSSQSIGITDSNPDIPAFYKYTYLFNVTTQQQYIFCFDKFLAEDPPFMTFVIPNICPRPQPAGLLRPLEKYKMANYMQLKMKLKHHTRNSL